MQYVITLSGLVIFVCAMTVGLPLAMASKLLGQERPRGEVTPRQEGSYESPVV